MKQEHNESRRQFIQKSAVCGTGIILSGAASQRLIAAAAWRSATPCPLIDPWGLVVYASILQHEDGVSRRAACAHPSCVVPLDRSRRYASS